MKQNREREKLKVTHDKQMEDLSSDVQKVKFLKCKFKSNIYKQLFCFSVD